VSGDEGSGGVESGSVGVGDGSAMEAEFDTLAAWTEDAVRELGPRYAIPAACRGSGSPADLRWLADGLGLHGDDRFLDAGAGLGGPAAWLQVHLGVRWQARPLVTDPMPHAVAAARRLFDQPAFAARSEELPLTDGSVDAAWALGVLCTTPEKRALLAELHRVLVPGAPLGLLVLVRTVDEVHNAPEGNTLPSRAELRADLAATGFTVSAEIDAAALPDAPVEWQEDGERVTEVIRRDHVDHPAWRQADEQGAQMGRLIGEQTVVTVLVRALRD